MKKNILCILLALCLMLCVLSACVKTDDKQEDGADDDTPADDVTEQAADAEAGDGSFDYSAYLDDNGYFIGVSAAKIVTLPEYKGVAIPADVMTVDDADIDAQLDSVAEAFAEYEQITGRAVEDGDTVNIDYVGSVDGVEFSGGSTGGEGTDVTIGVTSYIDDFLEQLIGHMPGETFDIEVTFPDPYENNPDLAGKDAVFNATINYIQGERIDTGLTDDMVSEYTGGELTTVEALRDYFRESMLAQQKRSWYQELIAGAQCGEIPETVMEYVKGSTLDYYESLAAAYGVSLDDFFAGMMGLESTEAFLEQSAEGFETTARCYLAIQAIAETEGLSVTDGDLTELGYDAYIETYGRGYVCQVVLQEQIVPGFIYENSAAA